MLDMETLIDASLVDLDLRAVDPRGAIELLVQRMAAAGRVTDPARVILDVLARERQTGGTGMESGVAIPHAKSPGVMVPTLAVGRSRRGIDFGAGDGRRSDLIFLIAAPDGADELHIRMLSRLARHLIHDSFRTSLRAARSADELVALMIGQIEMR
jgi:fructose-specific phosphotransferase system IIA component